jgi:hypothetical protein
VIQLAIGRSRASRLQRATARGGIIGHCLSGATGHCKEPADRKMYGGGNREWRGRPRHRVGWRQVHQHPIAFAAFPAALPPNH